MADPIIVGGIRVLAQTHTSATDLEVLSANSFIFATSPPSAVDSGDLDAAAAAVKSFYNDIGADLSKHVGFISFKAYDLGETPPRTPHEIAGLTAVSSAASLPSEVATCLSYFNGTVPRPKKRGRIFLGPLKQSVVDNTGSIPRVTSGHRTLVTDAAVDNFGTLSDLKWGLLSQTDEVIWEIEHVFMDDAFDTQRRRGEDPSTRTNASL